MEVRRETKKGEENGGPHFRKMTTTTKRLTSKQTTTTIKMKPGAVTFDAKTSIDATIKERAVNSNVNATANAIMHKHAVQAKLW